MDSSTQLAITSVATAVSTVMVAWIAYKQATISRNMETLKQQTNHIKDALVASTAKASHAEGKLEGRAEEKAAHL